MEEHPDIPSLVRQLGSSRKVTQVLAGRQLCDLLFSCPKSSHEVAAAGGIAAVVGMLRSPSATVQASAAQAASHLALCSPEHCLALAESGALLLLCGRPRLSDDARSSAAAALCNLCGICPAPELIQGIAESRKPSSVW